MAEYSKIAEGAFTSTGVAQFINLPFLPNSFEMWNITQWGTNTDNLVKYALGRPQAAAGTAYTTISNGTANNNVTITSGGFSFISAGTYQYGPTIALASTFVTQASPAIVTTASAHGLQTGDAVLLYGTTGMLQIAGEVYTVTVLSTTTFSIPVNSSGFASAATAGFMKKVLYPDLYIPYRCAITGVGATVTGVPTTQTVINCAVNHGFVVGQEVYFVVPKVSSTAWGALWLDTLAYNTANVVPQQAYVTQTTANNSNLALNQIVVRLDNTGQAAFAYPTSAQAALGMNFPAVYGIGDQNFGVSGPGPFTPPITIPGAFYANTRQGVLIGVGNGTQIMMATNDVIRWRAIYPDIIL
jgi:hypothetical protein